VSSVRSAGARRSCNVNARWRLVDFLTMETTVPRPQVLALPPARARAHPKHDPVLTHPLSTVRAGRSAHRAAAVHFRCALVAEASRELQTCRGRQNAAARAAVGGGSAGGA